MSGTVGHSAGPASGLNERFRRVEHSKTFARLSRAYGLSEKKVLDLGSGYGEFLAHFGKGSVGITTTKAEVEEGNRRGLDVRLGNIERLDETPLEGRFEILWANNVIEHLLSPHAFLLGLRARGEPRALLVLGADVLPRAASLTLFRRFRGPLAQSHVHFFTRDTIRLTLERAGWRVREMRSYYIGVPFVDRLLAPWMPHLYVVAELVPDFRYPEKKLKEWEGDPVYAKLLAETGQN